MNKLSIERINAKSPYHINEIKDGFEFVTPQDVIYRIYFLEEEPMGGCETMQFILNKVNDIDASHDSNVSAITFLIIDEFFSENNDVLLYICDTTDQREAARNRLFLRWFEKAANPNRFTIRSANSIIEGQGFYAAIILENKNPNYTAVIEEFEATVSTLEK